MNEKLIIGHWPLTNVDSVRTLKQSGERIVYEVSSAEGTFVFKVADPSKNEAVVIKDTEVLRFFEKNGYPAPRLLPAFTGAGYVREGNKFIYAISLIEGAEPEKNVENYNQLGKVTAELHKLNGYDISTDFTAATEVPRMIARARTYNMEPRYEALVAALPDFNPLPSCLIHTDIGAHNAIKQPNGQIVLVDWDDAGIGTRILDIGFPLICDFVSNDLIFDKERAAAFYRSYCEVVILNEDEKRSIFDAGLFYALSYTIFDDSGIVAGQWKKVLYAIEHKDEILSVLPF